MAMRVDVLKGRATYAVGIDREVNLNRRHHVGIGPVADKHPTGGVGLRRRAVGGVVGGGVTRLIDLIGLSRLHAGCRDILEIKRGGRVGATGVVGDGRFADMDPSA